MDGMKFTQVYAPGWKALASLAGDEVATKLYVFLAEQSDRENCLAATYAVLGDAIGSSERTIRRAVRRLIDQGHVRVLRISGSANLYVMNPDEVKKSAITGPTYLTVRSRTLIGTSGRVNIARLFEPAAQADLDL
jgi:hypothetical protein